MVSCVVCGTFKTRVNSDNDNAIASGSYPYNGARGRRRGCRCARLCLRLLLFFRLRAGLLLWAAADCDVVFYIGKCRGTDSAHILYIFYCRKRTLGVAIVDNSLRFHIANTGKCLELVYVGSVDIDGMMREDRRCGKQKHNKKSEQTLSTCPAFHYLHGERAQGLPEKLRLPAPNHG